MADTDSASNSEDYINACFRKIAPFNKLKVMRCPDDGGGCLF